MNIVLTGGPSAGKTSLAEVLSRTYMDILCIVPEAASILFKGGFPRYQGRTQLEYQQRAIYFVQRELEQAVAAQFPNLSLICDRGSLDALAYWPGSSESFFNSLGTSMNAEIKRYDWVVHLETAGPTDYKSSSIRTETNVEAHSLDERVKRAWSLHPNRVIIPNSSSFPTKIQLAIKILRLILDKKDLSTIQRFIESEVGN